MTWNAPDFIDGMIRAGANGWYNNGIHPLSSYPELAPFVYYIQDGPLVKIGTSINPERRCDQLRRADPLKSTTTLPMTWGGHPELLTYHRGSAHVEREMHRLFAHLRAEGEWFHIGADLEEHIHDVALDQSMQEIVISEKRRLAYLDRHGLEDAKDNREVFNRHLMTWRGPDMSLYRDAS